MARIAATAAHGTRPWCQQRRRCLHRRLPRRPRHRLPRRRPGFGGSSSMTKHRHPGHHSPSRSRPCRQLPHHHRFGATIRASAVLRMVPVRTAVPDLFLFSTVSRRSACSAPTAVTAAHATLGHRHHHLLSFPSCHRHRQPLRDLQFGGSSSFGYHLPSSSSLRSCVALRRSCSKLHRSWRLFASFLTRTVRQGDTSRWLTQLTREILGILVSAMRKTWTMFMQGCIYRFPKTSSPRSRQQAQV